MNPAELTGAVMVLFVSAGVGIVAHELAHALALTAFGVSYRVEWTPDRDDEGFLEMIFFGNVAAVTPEKIPEKRAALRLRIASMMPLTLLVPLSGIPLGIVQPSLWVESLYVQVALIGWAACALPSPQDFSVLWHAPKIVAKRRRNKTDQS